MTFDKLAASCGEWLTKGRQVALVAKLRLSEWTGPYHQGTTLDRR